MSESKLESMSSCVVRMMRAYVLLLSLWSFSSTVISKQVIK